MVFPQPTGAVAQISVHAPKEEVIVTMTHTVQEISDVAITIVNEISHLLEVTGPQELIVVIVSRTSLSILTMIL